ncbi:M28 family peptidase [bacterium]|nr:M28 family peptidase [bacterium]
MFVMPGRSYSGPLPALTSEEREIADNLERHVRALAGEIGERNVFVYHQLVASEQYISNQWRVLGASPERQAFAAYGREVANVEIAMPGANRPDAIFVVGAHYDSAQGSPGANDNGSGVAALLELSRLLGDQRFAITLRLVAFVNEEPPFFHGPESGSHVYAKRCKERGENVVGMISLETIGYYRDEPGTQRYPPPFAWFYPDRGDFIGFVGNLSSRGLVREAIGSFPRHARFPSEGTAAWGAMTGIGWSDHACFWKQGYSAIMLTDTALFRYPYYHSGEDTPDKLDYERTARVVGGIAAMLSDLCAR